MTYAVVAVMLLALAGCAVQRVKMDPPPTCECEMNEDDPAWDPCCNGVTHEI